jgi:metal-sulfur cluster biosynthetic enzyme
MASNQRLAGRIFFRSYRRARDLWYVLFPTPFESFIRLFRHINIQVCSHLGLGFCSVPRYLNLISTISDPEHPVSLGQLSVINLSDIHITPSPALGIPDPNTIVQVVVEITPTITHCSLATVIGLGVRVRLEQSLPPNYRVDVTCKENSHNQDDQVNKQLGDKERVAAALENDTLKGVLDKMLETCA